MKQQNQKHVAVFTPTLGGGGAERTVVLLANALIEQDYKVSLLVASTKGVKGKLLVEVDKKVNLIDLQSGRVLSSVPKIAKWLKAYHPDSLISSQTHANIATYFATQMARYRGKLILREVSTPSVNLKSITGIKQAALKKLMVFVYQKADEVIAVSNGVKDDLEQYLGIKLKNIKVIYDPVVHDEMFELAKEPIEHPWFQSDRKQPVILAVGRLTEAKNYELLINAFRLVLDKKEARLVILGEGEDREKLEKLVSDLGIKDKVDLHGFEINPFKYMANCDLYVMSSKWEGLPGALIQALALGAKIISTDCPSGPREILKNGKYGYLANDYSNINFAMLILTALTKKNEKFSETFHEFTAKEYIFQIEKLLN